MTQAPDAPRATVFDFMTRGQIKEFHEVFGRYIDWCAAQGLPQAASEPTDALDAATPYDLGFAHGVRFADENLTGKDIAMAERPAEGGSNG